mgnify:CR=1
MKPKNVIGDIARAGVFFGLTKIAQTMINVARNAIPGFPKAKKIFKNKDLVFLDLVPKI